MKLLTLAFACRLPQNYNEVISTKTHTERAVMQFITSHFKGTLREELFSYPVYWQETK
jgi:hypothetical protein